MAYEPVTAAEMLRYRGPRPGVVAFRDAVLFWTTGKGTSNGGIYNRRYVAGSNLYSLHSVGRAWDCMVRLDSKAVGDELVERAVAQAGWLGVMEIIWYRRRWTAEKGWQPYGGVSPHTDHIHFGFTKQWADNPATHESLVKWVSFFMFGIGG